MKRILGFLAAALFATAAIGAEVTTSGLLGTSGESGLSETTVAEKVVTFKPTAAGGAIMIQVFDDDSGDELLRHSIPVKMLTLNQANTVFTLRDIDSDNVETSVGDQRVVAYAKGHNLRVEFMLAGKVSGTFGGATIDGLGDGLFVWNVTTTGGAGADKTFMSTTKDISGAYSVSAISANPAGTMSGKTKAVVKATGSGITQRGRALLVGLCRASTDADRNPCAVDNCTKWGEAPATGTFEESCLNLYKASTTNGGCEASCL